MVRAPAATAAAIEAGPIDPSQALPLARIDQLADSPVLPAETGWCWLPDGVGYVAVMTRMPGVSGEMIDWWFDWHPRDPERYKLWHPIAHFDNRLEQSEAHTGKAFWGATHYPVEDVGTGKEELRIQFKRPSELGFSSDLLDHPRVATCVGGWVGSVERRARFAQVTHVFLKADDGLLLRSRFWLGANIRPDWGGNLVARVANTRPIRRVAIPRAAPARLAHHCADEFANLASILPDLYSSESDT